MTDKLDSVRPMFELRGRNYLITGGAQGIGFATTRAICEMGGNVAVLDIQEQPTAEFDELASKFGVKTSYHRTDLTKQNSLNAGFEKALKALGGSIDGCVPAAGIAIDKPFVDQTWDEFTRIQEINVSSALAERYGLERLTLTRCAECSSLSSS
jgi:sorbose reductase